MPRRDRDPKMWVSLFEERSKKNRKGPDFTGNMRIPEDIIDEIRNAKPNRDGEVELRIALWWKEGRSGDYLNGEAQLNDRDSGGGRGRDRDRDRDDDRGRSRGRDREDRDDDRRSRRSNEDPDEEIPF